MSRLWSTSRVYERKRCGVLLLMREGVRLMDCKADEGGVERVARQGAAGEVQCGGLPIAGRRLQGRRQGGGLCVMLAHAFNFGGRREFLQALVRQKGRGVKGLMKKR